MTIKVLVVDDEEMVRLNLVAFLEDEGFDVNDYCCAETALENLSQCNPDIAIVDMRLPKMNGGEFILKAHDVLPDLGFIIHTGSNEYQLSAELREIGLKTSALLYKPLSDLQLLVTQIHSNLKKSVTNISNS